MPLSSTATRTPARGRPAECRRTRDRREEARNRDRGQAVGFECLGPGRTFLVFGWLDVEPFEEIEGAGAARRGPSRSQTWASSLSRSAVPLALASSCAAISAAATMARSMARVTERSRSMTVTTPIVWPPRWTGTTSNRAGMIPVRSATSRPNRASRLWIDDFDRLAGARAVAGEPVRDGHTCAEDGVGAGTVGGDVLEERLVVAEQRERHRPGQCVGVQTGEARSGRRPIPAWSDGICSVGHDRTILGPCRRRSSMS